VLLNYLCCKVNLPAFVATQLLQYLATMVSSDAYTIPSCETMPLCQYLYLSTQMTNGMVKITMALLQCIALVKKNMVEALYVYADDGKQCSIPKKSEFRISEIARATSSGTIRLTVKIVGSCRSTEAVPPPLILSTWLRSLISCALLWAG